MARCGNTAKAEVPRFWDQVDVEVNEKSWTGFQSGSSGVWGCDWPQWGSQGRSWGGSRKVGEAKRGAGYRREWSVTWVCM